MPHVPFLDRVHRDQRCPAGPAPDQLADVIHRDPRPSTNIVHTAWNAPEPSSHGRRHRISDKCEITSLISVTEQTNSFASMSCLQESVESHVGPLTRSVNREIP